MGISTRVSKILTANENRVKISSVVEFSVAEIALVQSVSSSYLV